MTNAVFDAGRQGILDGTISIPNASIKVALVSGYTFNSAHTYVSDVTGSGATVAATSAALTTKVTTGGVFGADNTSFATVAPGQPCNCLLVFQSSAAAGGADVATTAQRLIAYIDTGAGLPVTPAGNTINVTWDSGPNKIFRI